MIETKIILHSLFLQNSLNAQITNLCNAFHSVSKSKTVLELDIDGISSSRLMVKINYDWLLCYIISIERMRMIHFYLFLNLIGRYTYSDHFGVEWMKKRIMQKNYV